MGGTCVHHEMEIDSEGRRYLLLNYRIIWKESCAVRVPYNIPMLGAVSR